MGLDQYAGFRDSNGEVHENLRIDLVPFLTPLFLLDITLLS